MKDHGEMDMSCPRNKILIAFESSAVQHTRGTREVLEQIFGLKDEELQQNIVKNLTWKTKYYECQYDLYIDEFKDLGSWLRDLDGSEYEELRAVLAGVILVKSFNRDEHRALLSQFAGIQSQGSFLIWCNSSRELDEETIDSANSSLWASNASAEMVDWHCRRNVNEYGEKAGLDRLKEIIDTYEWTKRDTINERDTIDTMLPDEVESNQTMTDNLEAVVSKLQKARQRFQNMEGRDNQSSSFALAMAEEIAELL